MKNWMRVGWIAVAIGVVLYLIRMWISANTFTVEVGYRTITCGFPDSVSVFGVGVAECNAKAESLQGTMMMLTIGAVVFVMIGILALGFVWTERRHAGGTDSTATGKAQTP
jgi:uncharacterized membrane protein YiaA